MIHIIYQNGWDVALSAEQDVHFCANLLRGDKASLQGGVSTVVQRLIAMALTAFDTDSSLKGLLTVADCESYTLSPFSVTRHFCVKVLSASMHGRFMLNVSPIYHLGLDYPEEYRRQQGKALDPSAIIGLVEIAGSDRKESEPDSHLFRYGVDAGVVFADCLAAHNKSVELQLAVFEDYIQATVDCESQVSTHTVQLEEFSQPINLDNYRDMSSILPSHSIIETA